MDANIDILKSLVSELLALMSVNGTSEVNYDKENEVYLVTIDASDAVGLLIGKKGETLESLENLLGVMLKGKTGQWYRVSVNIGDYKAKEEEYLKGIARSAVTRVKASGKPENIYNLKGWQRRVVHLFLAEEFPEISSESEGEGEERCLVIKLKNT